jgi:predicted lipoprotein with Yx(FWY)xxD motif
MKNRLILMALLLAGAILLAGCTQPQTTPVTPVPTTALPATTAPPIPAPTPVTETIKVASNPQYGQILTDANGMTLYYFTRDMPSTQTSACTGACIGIWPVFSAETVQVSGSLLASNFGSFTRADGTKQTTFLGWPLYYYTPDTAPGDTKGHGVNGVWFVINPGGIVTLTPTTTIPTTTPTTVPTTYSSGGGYY